MAVDHIRYDILAQDALRGVVRRVLIDAAKSGLPGEHHFYISFDTRAPGVRISSRLKERYPEEMTIVLQHQFWDLIVGETGFEVGLSFNGVPEKLVVPFEALKGFFDPSVQFGLQFETLAEQPAGESPAAGDADKPARPPARATGPQIQAVPKPSTKPKPPAKAEPAASNSDRKGAPKPVAPVAPVAAATKPTDDEPDEPSGGGQVVKLDRFRKKK